MWIRGAIASLFFMMWQVINEMCIGLSGNDANLCLNKDPGEKTCRLFKFALIFSKSRRYQRFLLATELLRIKTGMRGNDPFIAGMTVSSCAILIKVQFVSQVKEKGSTFRNVSACLV